MRGVRPLIGDDSVRCRIIVTALVGSVCIFACFSASALLSTRRSALYLSGMLSSALTLLLWVGIANMFFRSELLFTMQLYGGLFIFSGFVLFDTQLIIEKVSAGQTDYLWHALSLFLGTLPRSLYRLFFRCTRVRCLTLLLLLLLSLSSVWLVNCWQTLSTSLCVW